MIKRIAAAVSGIALAVLAGAGVSAASSAGYSARAVRLHRPQTVYVYNQGAGTVVPIRVATDRALRPINVGLNQNVFTPAPFTGRLLASTPNGGTVYLLNQGLDSVKAISTRTNKVVATIALTTPSQPISLAISPDGKTAYVLGDNSGYYSTGWVVPINTRTNHAGTPIQVGAYPVAMVFSRSGRTGYVLVTGTDPTGDGALVRIDVATNKIVGPSITVGVRPLAMAMTPNGKAIYVVNSRNAITGIGSVTPVTTATNSAGRPIMVGWTPNAIAITSDGGLGYVVDQLGTGGHATTQSVVTPIRLSTGTAGKPIQVGLSATAIAITPGSAAFVLNNLNGEVNGHGTVTPLRIPANRARPNIGVGSDPQAIAVSTSGKTVFVANAGSGTVTAISTSTYRVSKVIRVGARYTAGPDALLVIP